MRKNARQILDQALKLSEDERLGLADALLGTIEPGRYAAVDAEWLVEAERRSQQLEREPGSAVPYSTAVRHVEARLRRKS